MSEATLPSTAVPAGRRAEPASFLGRTEELELIGRLLVGGAARLFTPCKEIAGGDDERH
jgi:hypothetical protein